MLGEFWLFFRGIIVAFANWFHSPSQNGDLQSQRRLTTHRSIRTTATAHAAMRAGTSAASASAPGGAGAIREATRERGS
jgi:hypothetical protein